MKRTALAAVVVIVGIGCFTLCSLPAVPLPEHHLVGIRVCELADTLSMLDEKGATDVKVVPALSMPSKENYCPCERGAHCIPITGSRVVSVYITYAIQ